MMKCRKCGARVNDDAMFCEVCGAPVEREKNGNTKWILLGAGIAVAAVLAAFAVWSLFIRDEGNTAGSGDLQTSERNIDDSGYDGEYYDDGYDSGYADSGEYILDGSDREYISEDVLSGLSDEELMLARNEIYARHGRIFNDSDIRAYFMSQSWYEGTIQPDDFTDDMLNDIEKTNLERIVAEEEAREQ